MPPRLQKPGTRVPRVLAPQEDEGLSNDPYSSSIGPAPTNSWHKSVVDFLDDPTAGLRNWLREQSPNASDEYGNDKWLPSDLLGMFSENFQGKGDAAPGAPGHIPAVEASSIVPKVFWKQRVADLGEQMDRAIPYLKDIPRAEKFVGDMKRFLDLHEPMAAHVNSISLQEPDLYTANYGPRSNGNYQSALNGVMWRNKPGDPYEVIRNNRAHALEAAKTEQNLERQFNFKDPQPEEYDTYNRGYSKILDNQINLRESSQWSDPLEMFNTPRHELTHAAQDIGDPYKYNKDLIGYDSSHPEYWIDPLEIGARVGGQKGATDFQRTLGNSIGGSSTVFKYLDEMKNGVNLFNAKAQGSGRNTLNRFNNVVVPEINRGLNSPKYNLGGTVLEPKVASKLPVIPGQIVPAFDKDNPNWLRMNANWSPWNKYSLILGLSGKE